MNTKIKCIAALRFAMHFFNLQEGIRQAGMLAFPFAAAHEREKLAKRVSHRLFMY